MTFGPCSFLNLHPPQPSSLLLLPSSLLFFLYPIQLSPHQNFATVELIFRYFKFESVRMQCQDQQSESCDGNKTNE